MATVWTSYSPGPRLPKRYLGGTPRVPKGICTRPDDWITSALKSGCPTCYNNGPELRPPNRSRHFAESGPRLLSNSTLASTHAPPLLHIRLGQAHAVAALILHILPAPSVTNPVPHQFPAKGHPQDDSAAFFALLPRNFGSGSALGGS